VGNGADEQVSAEPWRLAPIEPPTLFAQFVKTEIPKSLEPSLHFHVATCHSCCFALWQTSLFHGS